jgi:hypothetical protein
MTNQDAIKALEQIINYAIHKGLFANLQGVETAAEALRVLKKMDAEIIELTIKNNTHA